MSASTHDPLVVNTQDGSCWVRRAVTRAGRGLYALEGTAVGAPDMVLATLAELAEHGLSSMRMDALPVPAGSAPRPVRPVRDLVVDGEHYALVHHDYRVGHDLPETGGQR